MKKSITKTAAWILLAVTCAACAAFLLTYEQGSAETVQVAKQELMTIGYGDVDDPCTVQVDPDTYDELVKMGILDWVEACNAAQ